MTTLSHVLVVGASAAGLSTAEALRRKGYVGRLTLLGAEQHVPYDRPPLSKKVLAGEWEPERAYLRKPDMLSAVDAEFVLGDPATALDVAGRIVHTRDGRKLSADAVVIATGVRPRLLPGQEGLGGVHLLRTLDDSLALRTDLLRASRVVVVGDGVLGAEVAATARTMGLDVTLTGPQRAPMEAQLGSLVAAQLGELHTDRGVQLRLGDGVSGLESVSGRVTGVRLSRGDVLPADVVVVAVGAQPETGWLETSGLQLDDGVVCDTHCRAADGVYAAGDVARWRHRTLDTLLRLENRTNATEQAGAVAATILGDNRPYCPVPYFWTDQFDVKIQIFGHLPPNADVSIVDGRLGGGRFVARYHRNGVVTGVLGWNMPKQIRQRRHEVVDSLALAPAFP